MLGSAIVAGQGNGKGEDAGHALEFVFGRVAHIHENFVGKRKVFHAASAHIGRDDDELIWIFIRKGPQQDGIRDAEDGGAGPDAQGNGEYGGERKDGTFSQGSGGKCQIL